MVENSGSHLRDPDEELELGSDRIHPGSGLSRHAAQSYFPLNLVQAEAKDVTVEEWGEEVRTTKAQKEAKLNRIKEL